MAEYELLRGITRKVLKSRSNGGRIMTNFLPAGFLKEDLEELKDGLACLQRLLGASKEQRQLLVRQQAASGRVSSYDQLVKKTLTSLTETATRAHALLDDLPADPLIYTGPGATSEVLHMLEGLMASHPDARLALREASDD